MSSLCAIHANVIALDGVCAYCARVLESIRAECAGLPYAHSRAIREQLREAASARRRAKPDSIFGAPRKLTPEVLVELTGFSLTWVRKLLDRGDTPHSIAAGKHRRKRPAHCQPQSARRMAAWRSEAR